MSDVSDKLPLPLPTENVSSELQTFYKLLNLVTTHGKSDGVTDTDEELYEIRYRLPAKPWERFYIRHFEFLFEAHVKAKRISQAPNPFPNDCMFSSFEIHEPLDVDDSREVFLNVGNYK